MNPVAEVQRTTSAPDGVLVQEAAAGGGASYAALYDRYAEQVYNYCLRLTGSPDDAADATQDAFVNVLARLHQDDRPVLEFSAYLFAAARNESYALMRRRSRAQPSEEAPERAAPEPDVHTDPERAALLRDSQEAVRMANGKLAPRHREVLALREVAGRSYEEIGHIMGISENAAAQLIWRARAKLKVALTAGAVASVVAATDECETAQMLINRLNDGESITGAEQEWLDEHLEECGKCRAARGMIFEVATSYRLWMPVALLATMKADTLAAAGSVIGADWSTAHLSGGAAHGANGGAAHGGAAHAGHASLFAKRPRGAQAAAGAAVTAAVMAGLAIVVAGLGNGESNSGVKPSAPAAETAKDSAANPAPKSKPAAPAASSSVSGFSNAAERRQLAPAALRSPAGQPDRQTSGAPNGAPRQAPGQGNRPGDGQPGNPRGGNPGSPGGGPGNPPGGGGPGNGPGNPPGGGPGNPPGNPPGGQPGNPPGNGPPPPVEQPPPVDEPPANPPPTGGGDCTWPGHGNGPGGCPPGHGGVPPGQGGTPPGQTKP